MDADHLEHMAEQVDGTWTRARIDKFLSALSVAGLVQDRGGAQYELHPALTGFLRSRCTAGESRDRWARAFTDVMGSLADALAPRELHDQRGPFYVHGANFHNAMREAERLDMPTDPAALMQSLAAYALNTRNFKGAERLFSRPAELGAETGDQELQAAAYHQLGIIAEERRDFEQAEKWYLKSLAIDEKQGNEHGAAISYGQLGLLGERRGQYADSGQWLIKSIQTFVACNDAERARQGMSAFAAVLDSAGPAERAELETMWRNAGLGEFPGGDGSSGN